MAMQKTLDLTPEEMAVYRATARQRAAQEMRQVARRQEHAWDLARTAARLLKEEFGAARVMVFGSLVHAGCFTRWSDVDIAAWGIRPEDTFRAMGAVMDLDAEVTLSLMAVEACRPALRAAIEREGIEL